VWEQQGITMSLSEMTGEQEAPRTVLATCAVKGTATHRTGTNAPPPVRRAPWPKQREHQIEGVKMSLGLRAI
jgi:hypothetical protein